MNNKPVAELLINDGEPWGCRYSDEGTYLNANGSRMDGWIPLYTHPVKELTHEKYFCSRCGKRLGDGIHTCTPPVDILRKAQEQ